MFLILLHFIILVLLPCDSTAKQNCDNSICNYEAVCNIENNTPTCKCVENFFEGEFCSKPIDQCISNPCENGGTCNSYMGHYFCECVAGFSAQKCNSKQNALKGFHLHYNHIAPIGEQQTLLLMLQSHGTGKVLMEFYTSDYIIDGGGFTPSSGHFKPSKNLRALGDRLGIRHSNELPYKEGFYRICKATFWNLGVSTMTIDLSDYAGSAENFFHNQFFIFVYNPLPNKCLPVLHLPHCSNPRKSLHIDIVKFNFVEPIVYKRCAKHSSLGIQWSVRNYVNTGSTSLPTVATYYNGFLFYAVVLHNFPKDRSTILTIPPYTMWFNYLDDYVQSYLIVGDVAEVDPKGKVVGKTVLRCYVFVDSKPTAAHILGGSYREINANKPFVIDGSLSRDYARHPDVDQQLEYRWSCASEDNENPYCSKDMGSQPRLNIPRGALKLDQTYMFTLHVKSTINIYSSDPASQEIKVTTNDPLFIYFHCLRNCEEDKFASGKVIHLRIECVDCPKGHITYSVSNDQGTKVADSRSVILTEGTKNAVSLKAEATLGSRKGVTSIKLTLNTPPDKGTCTISPSSGTEYQTIFEISCPGYHDDDIPITYKYRAGNTTLDHSGNYTLLTTLFPTSGQNCELKISICDDIDACTDVQLQATLNPISPDVSWLAFLSQKESNLKQLIEDGDRSNAISLIRTVIPHMSGDESLKIAEHIAVSLRYLKVSRLVAVEQVLTVGTGLLEMLEPTSGSVALVSELFSKVADGLLYCIQSKEIVDQSLEIHKEFLGNLVQSMTKVTAEFEEFPMIHDGELIPLEDPFSENYTDYGELDVDGVVRISNWLQAFNSMHKCLQILGVVSAFIQLPDGTPIIIQRKGITTRTVVIDKFESVSLSWNQSKSFISLPEKFLRSLNGKEIAIQLSIFEANPFWWNPEQYKMNTEVISVGAYTRELKSLKSSSTKVPFSFFMTIKDSDVGEGIVVQGNVNNSLHMPVYEKLLPAHAVLVVNFAPPDKDIRILLTISKKPRSYMLQKANKVEASKGNATFFLVNHSGTERRAFLAIKAESHAQFSFTMFARLCLTWNPSTFKWTSEHCSVGMKTNSTHIHCSCWHLSMFGGKVHPTFGNLQLSRDLVQNLSPNYVMIGLYLLIVIVLCFLMWLAWHQDVAAAGALIVLNSMPGRKSPHRYLVTIYTNGHSNAGTTSNITIQLHGSLSDSEQYILYSTSCNSLFQRNFQASFMIISDTSLGTLESVSLGHDSFGRYPTWNCHTVKVRDKKNKNEYIFLANEWLSNYESTKCTALIPLANKEDLQGKGQVFKDTLTDGFANWYAQQALSPIRQCGYLTAVEKTSILVLRVCITLVGTIVVFGSTTMLTYEDERDIYYSMLLSVGKLLLIAFCCHLVGFIAAAALQYLLVRFRSRHRNVTYNLIYSEWQTL